TRRIGVAGVIWLMRGGALLTVTVGLTAASAGFTVMGGFGGGATFDACCRIPPTIPSGSPPIIPPVTPSGAPTPAKSSTGSTIRLIPVGTDVGSKSFFPVLCNGITCACCSVDCILGAFGGGGGGGPTIGIAHATFGITCGKTIGANSAHPIIAACP